MRYNYFNPLPPHGGRRQNAEGNTKMTHFNPLPPHGGRRIRSRIPNTHDRISIHSLRMEGDAFVRFALSFWIMISIHSLRMEGDGLTAGFRCFQGGFQSTPSAWRETSLSLSPEVLTLISIHSLRMEGDGTCSERVGRKAISIHSLRMEGDRLV